MNLNATSEATFGSLSRGDNDALSDRDILIVDADVATLQAREQELKAEGWSVASYTFKKLEFLASIGALFIQHLKAEATILRDEGGRLQSLIDGFHPKQSYKAEMEENFAFVALAARRPQTALGGMWAADVLYVALRNWGIMKLAESGCHTYAYSSVLECLSELGYLKSSDIPALKKLRLLKSLYRTGDSCSIEYARRILRDVRTSLPAEWPRVDFAELSPVHIIQADEAETTQASAYYRLRRLERLYVALQALKPDLKDHPDLERLRHWICDPRVYAHVAAKNEQDIQEAIERLCREIPYLWCEGPTPLSELKVAF